ncbi:10416_t:CDS:2, partial [Entrophospora sp. SA101]
MTIPGISNWFEWNWPTEGENAGYIQARGIPNIGRWTTFSPAQIQNITKNEISQPSPQVSEPTKPKSPWKIPLPHASGICPKRLALPELKNELTNRGIVYDNQNKRQKLIEMLDKELSQETLANVE